MYKVIIVSRCQKKALLKTREIVDKFALRVSDKTWNCNITKEGLDTLVKRLKHNARRNSAIAIYLLKDGSMQLVTIIGNKKEFGSDGACPVSTTKIDKKYLENNLFSNLTPYKKIVEFLGYVHDLGKVGGNFQDFLKNKKLKKSKEVFRHELLSVLIVASEFDKTKLISLLERLKNKNLFFSDLNFDNKLKKLMLIILSHHRLPALDGNNFNFNEYMRYDEKFDIDIILKYYEYDDFQSILKKAKVLLEEVLALNVTVGDEHYHYFRNSLMLSDHYISSKHNDCFYTVKKENLLAKKIEQGKKGAELLSIHLYSVSKMAMYILEDLLMFKDKLSGIDRFMLEDVKKSARGRFKWQNHSLRCFNNLYHKNNNCNFVILSASTGAGKTKTALRLASEMANEFGLRLNVLLGLRTLTTQTAKSYKEILNIDEDMIATLIGNKNAIELREKMQNDEVEDGDHENDIIIDGGYEEINIPSYIKTQAKSTSKKTLISSAIVISTIEYMIKASDWRRSKHLLPQLRLISSDMIIDEIDMYSNDDIKHLLNLVYIAGIYGKNVIITTATINQTLAYELSEMYKKGVKNYYKYLNRDFQGINLHFLSDFNNESKVIKDDSSEFLENCFVELSSKVKEFKSYQHKASIVKNNFEKMEDDFFNYINKLHNINKLKYKDISYSIGLIRVNSIKDAYELLKKFNQINKQFKSKNTIIKVVFYHSRLLNALRVYTEIILDEALYRKNEKIDNFVKSNLFLDSYKKIDAKTTDIITIVIATEVEEVGRDHDFDWGILEASSSRSIVQSIGRVNRHRDKTITDFNVFILDKNFMFQHNLKNNYRLTKNETNTLSTLYPSLNEECTSNSILNPQENTLPYIEELQLHEQLSNYTTKNTFFYSKDFVEKEWRQGLENITFMYDLEDEKLKIIDKDNKIIDNDKQIDYIKEDYDFCLINNKNFTTIISTMMEKNHSEIDEFSKKFLQVTSYTNKNYFSKSLGVI